MTTPTPDEQRIVATVRLLVAGTRIDLDFGPGQQETAQEIARLWSHLVIPEEGAAPADLRRTYVIPPPDERLLPAVAKLVSQGRVDVVGPLLTRPDAMFLTPGADAAYGISGDVTRALIGRLIGTRILLHAGVVALPGAGTVAVVGASGAGKSTATARLGREGTYLTDELAILDPATGAVTAYPKPVSHVDADGGPKRDHAPADLGLALAAEAAGLDHVLLLARDAEGQDGPARLEQVGLGEALLVIIAQSSSLWEVPGGLASLARIIGAAGGALRATYQEADELAALLATPPERVVEEWEEIAIPADAFPEEPVAGPDGSAVGPDAPAEEQGVEPGAVVLAPVRQALGTRDGVLILAEGRAGHLPGIVALAWEELLARGPLTPAALEEVLVELVGEHPDSASLVQDAIDTLVSGGWARLA